MKISPRWSRPWYFNNWVIKVGMWHGWGDFVSGGSVTPISLFNHRVLFHSWGLDIRLPSGEFMTLDYEKGYKWITSQIMRKR